MRTVNKVVLLGNVGREPEIKFTSGGGVMAAFTMATCYQTKAKETVTEWHRLVCFDRTAEIVRDYVIKGSKMYVEGQLQTRTWDKDGETRYTTEIIVRELSLLNNRAADASKAAALNGGTSPEITDEDIPF